MFPSLRRTPKDKLLQHSPRFFVIYFVIYFRLEYKFAFYDLAPSSGSFEKAKKREEILSKVTHFSSYFSLAECASNGILMNFFLLLLQILGNIDKFLYCSIMENFREAFSVCFRSVYSAEQFF